MRLNAISQLFKGLGALAFLVLIFSMPLVGIGYLAQVEHDRNVEILTSGRSASATVIKSHSFGTVCLFSYHFEINGQDYQGGDGGCPLVQSHPVGSSLNIRFDPKDPEESIAVGADLWPGWTIVPSLIALPLLFLGASFVYVIFQNVFGSWGRRRAKRKSGSRFVPLHHPADGPPPRAGEEL